MEDELKELESRLLRLVTHQVVEAERQDLKLSRPAARKRRNARRKQEASCGSNNSNAWPKSSSELSSDPDEAFDDFLALTVNLNYHWSFTTQQLDMLRSFARTICDSDEIAKNVLKHYRNHIVGQGITVTIVPKSIKDPEKLADTILNDANIQKMHDNWDAFYEGNNLTKKLLNWVDRVHRDGEAILRVFPPKKEFAGVKIPEIRFIEPYWVRGEDYSKQLHLGVKTEVDDVEELVSIRVQPRTLDGKAESYDVPAEQLIFDRRNVDEDTQRGISSFFSVLTNLRRIQKNLVNVSVLTQILSAIAFIRKHQMASAAKVTNFVRAQGDGVQRTNKITGKDNIARKGEPGTILDAPQGMEYVFPAHNVNTLNFIQVIDKELASVSSAFVLPISWLKAEETPQPLGDGSPTVKNFQTEQGIIFGYLTELFWNVMGMMGVNPAERNNYKIQFFGPILSTADPEAQSRIYEVEQRVGSLSPQTIASLRGRNYAQERANTILHRRSAQPGEVMPGDTGNTNVGGNNPSASTGGDGKTTKDKSTPKPPATNKESIDSVPAPPKIRGAW